MTGNYSFLVFFIIIYIASSLAKWTLTRLNIRNIRRFGNTVPDVFNDSIDSDVLSKMSSYTVESSRFASAEALFNDGILLIFILSGILPWMIGGIISWNLHSILSGLIFFAALALADTLIGIPFNLYSTFIIEKKYGFSTITYRLWLSDFLKSIIISGVLMTILLMPVLALIYYAEKTWWFWAWIFFASFQLLVLWLYPVLIAPLFNKYEPVKDEVLKEKIAELAARAGFKVKGVYQVDAGKRSKHSNAYFTGIGKSKRIVLYDTLLNSHTRDEILAVLGHEIGHWSRKHIRKQLIAMEVLSLEVFYLLYILLKWPGLYSAFGIENIYFFVGIFLAGILMRPVFFFFTPIGSCIARRFEKEADDFTFKLIGTVRPLAEALKRLAKDNLSNLYPHPLYVWFYYSHPPLIHRIERLYKLDRAKK
jgi:STE24 endopeptidase